MHKVIPFDDRSRLNLKLKSVVAFSDWKVNLAIDIPAGPVRVLPERNVQGEIKKPVHLYTAGKKARFEKETIFGTSFDNDQPDETIVKVVPTVVSFPSHIQARNQRSGTAVAVQPFGRTGNPSFTTELPAFGIYSGVSLTQLNVEVPRSSLFFVDTNHNYRPSGSPFSFDTTYLLLTLHPRDWDSDFHVLFRARIALQEGKDRHNPHSWVPWRGTVSMLLSPSY